MLELLGATESTWQTKGSPAFSSRLATLNYLRELTPISENCRASISR
jgi:hypothetical protein